MAQDLFQYDKMIERALRGVVRDAIAQVARDGLRGEHHFYIGFGTHEPGVQLPVSLVTRFPDEMTIVIQHQFWDLEVGDDAFSVTLSFQRRPERLVIPFAAIKSFADPSVNFALEFAAPQTQAQAGAGADAKPETAPVETAELPPVPQPVADAPAKPERPTGEVVALDKFRKR